jgi:spermidine synthase
MDYWGVRAICVFLLALGASAAVVLLLAWHGRITRMAAIGVGVAVVLAGCSGPLFSQIYEKLLHKSGFGSLPALRHVVENRSGVIAVTEDGVVFGDGGYDGRFNTDLVRDTNGIVRSFAIGSFDRRPAETLMIGLASGSFAQVVVNHPGVEHLTIVEINPGYLSVIPKYPQVASLLHNPRVDIVIDDGRRWLVRNPQRKFDLIFINTTFNWRANATNLLSVEFLRLIRSRLKAGGIFYYNTTWSPEVFATGLSVFPFSLRVGSCLAVSDSPLTVDSPWWERALVEYRIDGRLALNPSDPAARSRLAEVLDMARGLDRAHSGNDLSMEGREGLRRRVGQARIVTDDNMGTEWRGATP